MMEKLNIVLVGAGNVACHLADALAGAGHQIVQVVGRSENSTRELAQKLNSAFTLNIAEIEKEADLCILAVGDGSIEEIVSKVDFGDMMVVHTSGSIPMEALASIDDHGVFYPLQTFSKTRPVDFSQVPIFVEAKNFESESLLISIGKTISKKVEICKSEQRKILHLAAVFACNFTNHFYAIAEGILEEHGLKFEHIEPLIRETAEKAIAQKAKNVQTGPAIRNDRVTMDKHLKLLEDDPDYQKIYSFVSDSIRGTYLGSSEL